MEDERTVEQGGLTPADIPFIADMSVAFVSQAHGGSAVSGRECEKCQTFLAALGNWTNDHMMSAGELEAYEARRCRVCGCGNDTPCMDEEEGPCGWVSADLCTTCAPAVSLLAGKEA